MPHLKFEINRHIPDATKVALAQRVRQLFAEVMDTGTDHISISIHKLKGPGSIFFLASQS